MEDHLERMEMQLKKMTAKNLGNSVEHDAAASSGADIELSYGDASYYEGSQEEEISEHASLLGEMR